MFKFREPLRRSKISRLCRLSRKQKKPNTKTARKKGWSQDLRRRPTRSTSNIWSSWSNKMGSWLIRLSWLATKSTRTTRKPLTQCFGCCWSSCCSFGRSKSRKGNWRYGRILTCLMLFECSIKTVMGSQQSKTLPLVLRSLDWKWCLSTLTCLSCNTQSRMTERWNIPILQSWFCPRMPTTRSCSKTGPRLSSNWKILARYSPRRPCSTFKTFSICL